MPTRLVGYCGSPSSARFLAREVVKVQRNTLHIFIRQSEVCLAIWEGPRGSGLQVRGPRKEVHEMRWVEVCRLGVPGRCRAPLGFGALSVTFPSTLPPDVDDRYGRQKVQETS